MQKTFKDIRLGDKVYELINGKFNEVIVDVIGDFKNNGESITTSSLNKWDVDLNETFHIKSSISVLFCKREDAFNHIQKKMEDLDASYKYQKDELKKVQHDILGEIKTISNIQVGDKVYIIADTMIETATITNMCGCEFTIKNDYDKLLKGGIIFYFGGVREDATYICQFSHKSISAMYWFFNLQGAVEHLNNKAKSLREQANFFENKAKTLR